MVVVRVQLRRRQHSVHGRVSDGDGRVLERAARSRRHVRRRHGHGRVPTVRTHMLTGSVVQSHLLRRLWFDILTV